MFLGVNVNLGEICLYWAQRQPNAVAIVTDTDARTWQALERSTSRLSAGLIRHGIGRGDLVGIYATNSLVWCELTIAVLRTGAAVVPLNPRFTAHEVAAVLSRFSLRAIAFDDQHATAARAAAGPDVLSIVMDHSGARHEREVCVADLGDGPHPDRRAGVSEADPALIALTSGTTGTPKGAVLTHGNLLAHIRQSMAANDWTTGTRMLCCVPLAFTGGVVNNFLAVYGAGGTLVLEESFDPTRALELICATPITAMIGVPVMWQGIAEVPDFAAADLSALRTAITGGAPVPDPLMRSYQAKGVAIRQAYALTEASGSVCIVPPERAIDKQTTAGLPNVHTALRIIDEDGAPSPDGTPGQIQVCGPQVFRGYWDDPEATARTLAAGWLSTGDIGSIDAEGFLTVHDRANDTIISGGINVYPAEIENAVAKYPGVIEAGAFGVPHRRWGQTVALAVRGDRIELDGLLAHCRTQLADYKQPRHVAIRSEPLPRSMSGKVLRRVLREQFEPTAYTRTQSA